MVEARASLGPSNNFVMVIRGTDDTDVVRTVSVNVQTNSEGNPLWTNPETLDGWLRTLNKCDSAARKVQNRPNKFNLKLIVLGGFLIEEGVPCAGCALADQINLGVDANPIDGVDGSLTCRLLSEPPPA